MTRSRHLSRLAPSGEVPRTHTEPPWIHLLSVSSLIPLHGLSAYSIQPQSLSLDHIRVSIVTGISVRTHSSKGTSETRLALVSFEHELSSCLVLGKAILCNHISPKRKGHHL
ncbi:hypothetical protein BDV24DRAFT_140793 [Aspergillus arachidicola]|uniref:Uncharacterized protein n=1 Tax=Aspergillus arachidicola TaxID=656916 RepID=A0A5N6XVL2_9EURO|nr:hypothetical protein BDV24DRAFT_140793 [Aspergillus arachidicola]